MIHMTHPPRPPEGKVLIERAMEITGLSRVSVSKHARAGNIPGAKKVGIAWTFTESGLRQFIGVEDVA